MFCKEIFMPFAKIKGAKKNQNITAINSKANCQATFCMPSKNKMIAKQNKAYNHAARVASGLSKRLHSQAAARRANKKKAPMYTGGNKNRIGNKTAKRTMAVMTRVFNMG